MPHPRNVIVIGHGMVAARFLEETVHRDPSGRQVHVTVVGDEAQGPYNRILLAHIVSGRLRPEELALPVPDSPAVTVRTAAATAIDPHRRRVTLDNGESVGYDELVLATGARPAFPPVAGIGTGDAPARGVTALRTLDDGHRIRALLRPGAPVVVLGGGVLGLETARVLAEGGLRVSVVESAPWLMRRQLDQEAAGILSERLTALGISVHSWRVAARWHPGTGLELDDGRVLAGDALIVATGVRARAELATAAGIRTDHGILVDDTLATSAPRIHAIGDCAQHPGGGAGLVQPGWEQARVLADLLTGTAPEARYTGSRPVTRLKADGIELVSMGESTGDDTSGTVRICDAEAGRYARLTVREGRVAGAILLGFADAAAAVTRLYDDATPLPEDRLGLVMGRVDPQPATAEADGGDTAVVCRCNGVTRARLESAWLDGARSRDEIARATRATTGCGGCTRDITALLAGWEGNAPAPAG